MGVFAMIVVFFVLILVGFGGAFISTKVTTRSATIMGAFAMIVVFIVLVLVGFGESPTRRTRNVQRPTYNFQLSTLNRRELPEEVEVLGAVLDFSLKR